MTFVCHFSVFKVLNMKQAKNNLLIVLVVCMQLAVWAQNPSKPAAPTVSPAELYEEHFVDGNIRFMENKYRAAQVYFKQAYAIDSSNANINYKLGTCLLYTAEDKHLAIRLLERAANNVSKRYDELEPSEKHAPFDTYYYLSSAYKMIGNSNKSGEYLSKFQELGKPSPKDMARLQHEVSEVETAIELKKKPVSVKIENLGDSINTEYDEYSPVVPADESVLIFTSKRPRERASDNDKAAEREEDVDYNEAIYIAHRRPDGKWSTAKSIGAPVSVNDKENEASVSISVDGQQLFIFKDVNGGDVYSSNLDGDKWSFPKPLGSNINTKHWETHASLSADGNTLYFVSNRPGGYGGRDIYRCVKLPNGKWSLAMNLGPTINTPYDEDAPFIHPDGRTLYFSSNGHKTMGGFDIFYSTKSAEDNVWSEPVNLGYPINTEEDDVFYTPTIDGHHAYYATARKGGFGGKDICRITIEDGTAVPVTLLRGFVSYEGDSARTKSVYSTVSATDVETGEKVQESHPNSKTGKYLLTLSPGTAGKTYKLSYEADGYESISDLVKIEVGSSYQDVEHEQPLKNVLFKISGTAISSPVDAAAQAKKAAAEAAANSANAASAAANAAANKAGEPQFENIHFVLGKAEVSKKSRPILDALVKYLKENKNATVELLGYTDYSGSDEGNTRLSLKRAKTAAAYLEKRGIDAARIVTHGFGSSHPLADNQNPDGTQNIEGMRLNRRVEIHVVKK